VLQSPRGCAGGSGFTGGTDFRHGNNPAKNTRRENEKVVSENENVSQNFRDYTVT
jgi:hypothetical protein